MMAAKKGFILAISSSVLLGLSYIFFTILLKSESISGILFYWFLFAFIFSLLFGLKERISISNEIRDKLSPLIILGLAEGLASILFLTGLKTLGPVLTSFMTQFVFVFVLIYSLIFLKERFNPLEILGVTIAIMGVFIINWNQGISIVRGSFLVLLAAFFFASSSFIAKRYIKKISPKTINLIRLFFIALFGLIYSFIQRVNLNLNASSITVIFAGSFLCAFLGFELFYNSLKYLKLGTANTIRALSPLFTISLALLIFSEMPNPIQITGSLLILTGVILMIKWQKK